MQFSFETSPARVVFGRGTVRTALPEEVERLGIQRLLVVSARALEPLAREVTAPFADAVVAWFTKVEQHVPADVAEQAVVVARRARADGVLSIGGGSTTGTAKIVARETGIPILAVPTTYAGSEMTPVWGLTRSGHKETGIDPAVQPRTVVLDPNLTDQLPRRLAVSSALNALAHVVEAHWAPRANPVSSALADEATTALATGLRAIGREGLQRAASPEASLRDPVATWAGTPAAAGEQLLYGAFLAGGTYAVTGAGLHHKICHVLGGAFNLPHAATHAVVLPNVLALNLPAVPAVGERIAHALGAEEAVSGMRRLYAEVGAPRTLAQIGLRPDQLDEAIDRVSAELPIANPRPVGTAEVRAVLTAAFGEVA
ncbi:maleylacetate reductase [Georgenia yuyongxinii]|uniref:Maleylacetate reductase n=1 Tax=Georgenia yuyongxinii TaxID=2589797 RepID=A0A552WX62_9MICO|nr:maleylacetate reductase [Georgenia yuyongxinii]TRW47256.1 maleylacetate reductase [Georgenia yuyongxinii]